MSICNLLQLGQSLKHLSFSGQWVSCGISSGIHSQRKIHYFFCLQKSFAAPRKTRCLQKSGKNDSRHLRQLLGRRSVNERNNNFSGSDTRTTIPHDTRAVYKFEGRQILKRLPCPPTFLLPSHFSKQPFSLNIFHKDSEIFFCAFYSFPYAEATRKIPCQFSRHNPALSTHASSHDK